MQIKGEEGGCWNRREAEREGIGKGRRIEEKGVGMRKEYLKESNGKPQMERGRDEERGEKRRVD